MATSNNPPTTPRHLRPWSVVDDQELKLLRELEQSVLTFSTYTAADRVGKILDQLRKLRG